MKITMDEASKKIAEFAWNCDADELARITGDIFGGTCFTTSSDDGSDMVLDFEPNEFYAGEFGEEND